MADCYALHLGVIEVNYADLPCENVAEVNRNVTCCVRGSACMGNGICQNSNGHGYYTADCTDPTMQDPACQTRCGGLVGAQITYNQTSKLWACCTYNGGQPNCSEPSNEIFPGPDPSSLTTVVYLPSTGSVIYPTATSTHTLPTSMSSHSSLPSSNTSSNTSSSSGSIGPGAAAGIGLGAGAGLILIAAAVAFFYVRRRKPTTMPVSSELKVQPSHELDANPPMSELGSRQRHELGSNDKDGPNTTARVV